IANKNETNPDSAVLVVTQDSTFTPSTTKAHIRFINLVPGTRNIDVAIKGTSTLLFTNRPFKSATEFVTVDPSSNFVLEIREAGTGTVKYDILPLAITAGSVYTVY